jgi:hypothetical protein
MTNLFIKKQKNTVEIDNELEKEIDTLKQLINTIKKNTEITYEEIDKVKKIRDELKRQYDANYKFPICLKNGEIDLRELNLRELNLRELNLRELDLREIDD